MTGSCTEPAWPKTMRGRIRSTPRRKTREAEQARCRISGCGLIKVRLFFASKTAHTMAARPAVQITMKERRKQRCARIIK